MKVSFTTKEFARLLELVHLGLSVAGAHADDPATMPERYGDLTQKLFGMAEGFGCAELVESDVNGELFLNEKLTDGIAREKLDAFIDDNFWSELTARLALRDLRAEAGEAAVSETELSPEHETKLAEFQDAYWREFETHGVDHLVLLRGGAGLKTARRSAHESADTHTTCCLRRDSSRLLACFSMHARCFDS